MQIVGITGSIGSGKTTTAGLLRKMGFVVHDVDKWCRGLYFKPDFIEIIRQNFPTCFENGCFNKRLLRQQVFNDHKALKRLEGLIHPFLKKRFLQIIHRQQRSNDVIFVDAALLFEMGWDKFCTFILMTHAPYEVQKQRVMIRDHVTAEHFEKIMDVQMDNHTRQFLSDYVLNTDQPIGCLKAELIQVIQEVMSC